VDHGKSTLIGDLTGIETDRLEEEKRRGISIELGFAWLDLDDGRVGIVDVPGHERFVRQMIAGAAGVDVVLLVVAADDGVMPQTREHLDIVDLLGVRHGIVVLTKADLVDAEWLELVTEDVRETLADTGLAQAPILRRGRDAASGDEDLEAIRRALSEQVHAAERAREHDDADRPLKISSDRVFTIKGFGTVVTGTVHSGSLRVGDEVQVLPQGPTGKVRGLQRHGQDVEMVTVGTRAAINLQGLGVEDVSRGDVIARPHTLPTTHLIDASFRLLPHLVGSLDQRASVLCHVGSAQIAATLTWLEEPPIPGETTTVQLRLERPVGWLPGESYVVRGFSEATDRGTILGGGRLLAPAWRRHRVCDEGRVTRARALRGGDPIEGLVASLAFLGAKGASARRLLHETPLTTSEVHDGLEALRRTQRVTDVDGVSVLHDSLQSVMEKLTACLGELHVSQPHRSAIGGDELRSRVRPDLSAPIFGLVLKRATEAGLITKTLDRYALMGFESFLSPHQAQACDRLREALQAGELSPPRLVDLPEITQLSPDALDEAIKLLVDAEEVVRISRELVYDAAILADLRERLVAHLKIHTTIDPTTFKSMTGASRKWSIPLFEHFDRERLTVRVGDLRRLR